jgi:hypothetical protein
MAGPDAEALLHDALERVRTISAIANEEDHWQERWDGLRQLRPLGRQAFDTALDLLRGQFWDRTLGCDLLAVLCNPDEDHQGHEAAAALVESSSGQDNPEFLWSLANALRCAADPIAIPVHLARRTVVPNIIVVTSPALVKERSPSCWVIC